MKGHGKMSDKVCIHFISSKDNTQLARPTVSPHVPREGDEVRLKGGADKGVFFRVTKVVWVYDEPEGPFDRVNIGLEAVK
jgi:hypothetical protein